MKGYMSFIFIKSMVNFCFRSMPHCLWFIPFRKIITLKIINSNGEEIFFSLLTLLPGILTYDQNQKCLARKSLHPDIVSNQRLRN
jgi:hypothetical protein